MIEFTEKALKQLKELADAEGLKYSVRIKIFGSGCVGGQHDMNFDEIITEMDEVIYQKDVQIIVDYFSLQLLEGTLIDYIETDFSSGFKLNIPKAKVSCGCGSSVGF